MRFRIDLKIFIFLILFYLTKQIEIYSSIMIFCIIHEMAHLIVGIIIGMIPDKIELMPFGLSISFKLNIEEYNTKVMNGNVREIKKVLVAVAGPTISIILSLIFFKYSKETWAYANLLIALFNLIPICPLDGGRILEGIIHIFYGGKIANETSKNISNTTIIIITMISSIGIYYFKNIAILLIVAYLWILVIRENKKYKFIDKYYRICQQ